MASLRVAPLVSLFWASLILHVPSVFTETIHILTTRSPQYHAVFDVFAASLNSIDGLNYTLATLNLYDAKDTKTGYKSSFWSRMLLYRWQFYLEHMSSMSTEGAPYLFVDNDVVFFPNPNCLSGILAQLDDSRDMVCMGEKYADRCNGGFILMRNTNRTREFIRQLIIRTEREVNDQAALNRMLQKSKLVQGSPSPKTSSDSAESGSDSDRDAYDFSLQQFNFAIIKPEYYWFGSPQGCGMAWKHTYPELCFIHAVCSSGPESKLRIARNGVLQWYRRVPKLQGKTPDDFLPSWTLLRLLNLTPKQLGITKSLGELT